jgi:peroxiredoxin
MARSDDVNTLPDGLPIPTDDGSCNHLKGMVLPALELRATSGRAVNLAALRDRTVLYIYPRTGRPDQESPSGWNEIPGARGCTPQSCSFRDHKAELESLGAKIFGLSTQDSEYQQEAVQRLHLPFELLSDCNFALTEALRLPTFTADGMRLIKRVTLVLQDGQIEKVFYPVFPPDRNAEEVIGWLRDNPARA